MIFNSRYWCKQPLAELCPSSPSVSVVRKSAFVPRNKPKELKLRLTDGAPMLWRDQFSTPERLWECTALAPVPVRGPQRVRRYAPGPELRATAISLATSAEKRNFAGGAFSPRLFFFFRPPSVSSSHPSSLQVSRCYRILEKARAESAGV